MINKEFLMIPGPTPLPPRVVAAMTQPMINHRGPRFKEIFKEAIDITKELINCSQDIFLVPSSGTGAMELAVENFTQRGEKVLVVDTGFFGERFYRINVAKGRNAERLEIPWGRAVLPEEITEILAKTMMSEQFFLLTMRLHPQSSTTSRKSQQELKKFQMV